MPESASARTPVVSVLTTGHDVADARLHRTVTALVRRGLAVEVHSSGQPQDAPSGAVFHPLGKRAGKARRALRSLVVPFRARGDVIITLDPDLLPATKVATLLRRRRMVVDIHEDYMALLADRSWARSLLGVAARLVARISTMLARRASLTVVADSHVPPLSASDRLVVRNLPEPLDTWKPPELEARPRAVYIGDVRRSRGLQTMIEAVQAAEPWELDIVGPVAPADEAWLRDNLPGDRIRFHGRLPLDRSWALAEGAWAGLCMLDDTPAFRAAVPTKLYEYLAQGLAVIATDLPRTAQIVTESGAGAMATSADEAAGILMRWYADPQELLEHRKAATEWAAKNLSEQWPFDELAEKVHGLALRG